MYVNGMGLSRNPALGRKLIEQAAVAGDAPAQKMSRENPTVGLAQPPRVPRSLDDRSPDDLTALNRRTFNETIRKPFDEITRMMKRMCEQNGGTNCARYDGSFQK